MNVDTLDPGCWLLDPGCPLPHSLVNILGNLKHLRWVVAAAAAAAIGAAAGAAAGPITQ